MWIVNNRKTFYAISVIVVAASLVSLLVWHLVPSVDFSGGTLIEIQYPNGAPSQASITAALAPIDPTAAVSSGGPNDYLIRMKVIPQSEESAVMAALSLNGTASTTEKNFDSIGPVLGAEALRKAYWSIALVILGIVLYITFAFRKVSEPVSSWKYGLVAVIALAHDVIIPAGVFSVLGHAAGYEVDTLFVTALLVILGFSVHNTIVVFDRVRENLRTDRAGTPFEQIVGKSVSQTLTRSFNTSFTVLLALIVLYALGGETTQHFTLALIVGIAAGTFSSVFIGSPLLVTLEKWRKKGNK